MNAKRTMLIVIVLMTLIVSTTTTSNAQTYNYQSYGFTKPMKDTKELVNGLLVPRGGNPYGIIKQNLVNYKFTGVEINYYSIGEHIGGVAYSIVRHGYPFDEGFSDLFLDEGQDISDVIRIVNSPESEIRIVTYADFQEFWEQDIWIGDEHGENWSTWARNLGIKFRKVKIKELEGQAVLLHKCKIIFHMGNGSPIAMNNPEKYDAQLDEQENKWGYKDTVITKMMPGQGFSEVPLPKPPKNDPKAPNICPPALPDPEAERLQDLENKLGETKSSLDEVMGNMVQALGKIDLQKQENAQLAQNNSKLNSEMQELRNEAAKNAALAEANFEKARWAYVKGINSKDSANDAKIGELQEAMRAARGLQEKAEKEMYQLGKDFRNEAANLKAQYTSALKIEQARQDSIVQAQNARDQKQDKRIDKLENRVDGLDKRVDGLDGRVTALEKSQKRQDEDIRNIQNVNTRQDTDIAGLKKADKEQRQALMAVEEHLQKQHDALDTRVTDGFNQLNDKLNIVANEAQKANKRANDAFAEAQAAKKAAAEANIKASSVDERVTEAILKQKLIDDEQDRRNAEAQRKLEEENEKRKREIDAAKQNQQPVIAPTNTQSATASNAGSTQPKVQPKKKNVKYVYGPSKTVTIKDTKIVQDDCPPGTNCGPGKKRMIILRDPATGQTTMIPEP